MKEEEVWRTKAIADGILAKDLMELGGVGEASMNFFFI